MLTGNNIHNALSFFLAISFFTVQGAEQPYRNQLKRDGGKEHHAQISYLVPLMKKLDEANQAFNTSFPWSTVNNFLNELKPEEIIGTKTSQGEQGKVLSIKQLEELSKAVEVFKRNLTQHNNQSPRRMDTANEKLFKPYTELMATQLKNASNNQDAARTKRLVDIVEQSNTLQEACSNNPTIKEAVEATKQAKHDRELETFEQTPKNKAQEEVAGQAESNVVMVTDSEPAEVQDDSIDPLPTIIPSEQQGQRTPTEAKISTGPIKPDNSTSWTSYWALYTGIVLALCLGFYWYYNQMPIPASSAVTAPLRVVKPMPVVQKSTPIINPIKAPKMIPQGCEYFHTFFDDGTILLGSPNS